MNQATRDEVYYAINTERDYQDRIWNSFTTTSKGQHSVAEWLVYMEDYLNEAKHITSRRADPEGTQRPLEIIRKIAAMAVACMEQNGCTIREKADPRRVMDEHGVSIDE